MKRKSFIKGRFLCICHLFLLFLLLEHPWVNGARLYHTIRAHVSTLATQAMVGGPSTPWVGPSASPKVTKLPQSYSTQAKAEQTVIIKELLRKATGLDSKPAAHPIRRRPSGRSPEPPQSPHGG